MKKYDAQALAIAMVVLVVASIIGISVYSRVAKDKTQSLDERASAEALQVSDVVLNYLTAYDVNKIITEANKIANSSSTNLDITLSEKGKNQISQLFTNLGIQDKLSSLSICPVSSTGSNDYYINITKADINTFFEITPGQEFAIPIKGETLGTNCATDIATVIRGDTQAGFSVTYIYGKSYSNGIAAAYKPYETSDTDNYCFSDDGTNCNNSNFQKDSETTSNWIAFKSDNTETIKVDLNKTSSDGQYRLDEIKVVAIAGTIGVAYQMAEPDKCSDSLGMINLQVGANCDGSYRGKSVLLPSKPWENSIFNYSIFNGEGSL